MGNYICIDGVKVPLTEDQIAMIKGTGAQAKKTAFSRANEGETYWLISDNCMVEEAYEAGFDEDEERFMCANYCTDRKLIKERAIREELSRRLWRFSMENGGGDINWSNTDKGKYRIYIHFEEHSIKCEIAQNIGDKSLNEVYFIDKETARRAIKEVVEPFCARQEVYDVIMKSEG